MRFEPEKEPNKNIKFVGNHRNNPIEVLNLSISDNLFVKIERTQ